MQGYYLIGGLFALLSSLVSKRLKKKFDKYSHLELRNGLSGIEIAQKMLRDHDIHDVRVVSVEGVLTDHYNPRNKTVNLSRAVHQGRNAAAAAVSAHEVGHAIQHARAYRWLTMRSRLVPMVNISSKFSQWVIMGGFALMASNQMGEMVLLGGIVLFGIGTLFSLVTLPVEYDASNRALVWMKEEHIVTEEEYSGAKDALKCAARTYLVAALGSLATLGYYIMKFMQARNRRQQQY